MKLFHIVLCLALSFSFSVVRSQSVLPSWQSINGRPYPQWFADAKLGIFVHWGLYSVPAYAGREGYGEWFYRGLMAGDPRRLDALRRFGANDTMDVFHRYAVLADQWRAEYWDPDQWADLFRRAGARYVLLVSKHHDGYCLWDWPRPALPRWTSLLSGPRRNIVADLSLAVRRAGLRMGLYFSLAEWNNPLHQWTVSPNDSVGRYVSEYMIPQFMDLVSKYRPDVVFSDGDWDNSADQWQSARLISWYYNTVGPDAIVNNRWGGGNRHGYKTPEYSSGIFDTLFPWAECRGLGRSFGLNHNEPLSNYLSSHELICHFAKLVAAGGGLTLNVGPEADGRIPLLQQERLLDLGHWLQINGEAIYASRPCPLPYEYDSSWSSQRTDSIIHFDWVRNAPIKGMSYDDFHIVWTGTVVPRFTERYTLRVEADDEMVVLLGSDTVINYRKGDTSHAALSAEISLTQGLPVSLRVFYAEHDLEAAAHLFWRSPNQPEEPIHGPFLGTYHCLQPSVCYTRQADTVYAVALDSPLPHVRLCHLPDPRRVASATILGTSQSITPHFEDGTLVLSPDLSDPILLHLPAPWVFKLIPRSE